MTSYDNLDIGSLGERKRAIFCVIPDNDSSFNYLVGMLYTQAFQALYFNADNNHGGELPIPVHIVMDEFANVALPDNFERILATMRSRRISVSIIIQNMAQLKALFKDSWENITGNCDTLLYLGGNEQSTHEYISKMLGKETIDTRTRGITKGQHGSSNTNYQNAGRELLTLDEVRLLDNSNALIFIRGERPLIDKKFDILSHPNTVLSFIMIMTVYGRFFKLFIYTAIAPVPLASFAGETTSFMGKSFIKSYVGVCMEGAVIVLSCIIFSAFASHSTPTIDTSITTVTMIWKYIGETIFNMLVLVGLIKGADRIVKELFGT